MNIIDLIDARANREPYRAFFDQYEKLWGVSFSKRHELDVLRGHEFILRFLHASDSLLKNEGLSTADLSALLFIGSGVANGHAFFDGRQWLAWFDVPDYQSELTSKVFVLHELIHALHYKLTPSFYFRTSAEKTLLWRQLLSEGIATYATKMLLHLNDGEALWGDYLSNE